MKLVLIFGLGIQGKKRANILKKKKIKYFTIDPELKKSNFKSVKDIPNNILDKASHAIISTPYNNRIKILDCLLKFDIKILIEKPAISSSKEIIFFKKNKKKLKSKIYVAYNHKFEKCIKDLKKIIKKRNEIGNLYSVSMTYGNGTARDVKLSKWKDKNTHGVGLDLMPHLLDIYYFLFNKLPKTKDQKKYIYRFENKSPDFINICFKNVNRNFINLKVSYMHWKNFFEIDIIGENGFVKLTGLPKWKSCKLIIGKRKLPSGIPKLKSKIYPNIDHTWEQEINKFINNQFEEIDVNKEINIYRIVSS
jgi:scyllo-inositol 2-dehydrogenase (NADP+)